MPGGSLTTKVTCAASSARAGERANLGILYRDRVMYVAGVEKPALPTIYSRFGKSAPAHCSSLGKAILAFQPEAEVRALLSRKPLVAFTPTTITGHAAFTKELADTRARGFGHGSDSNTGRARRRSAGTHGPGRALGSRPAERSRPGHRWLRG